MSHSAPDNELLRIIGDEVLKVLEPNHYEELTHTDMKIIADQVARRLERLVKLR